jgi:hypothetical protein
MIGLWSDVTPVRWFTVAKGNRALHAGVARALSSRAKGSAHHSFLKSPHTPFETQVHQFAHIDSITEPRDLAQAPVANAVVLVLM